MKKYLAFCMAFCVTVSSVLLPFDSQAVQAGQEKPVESVEFVYPTGLLEAEMIETPLTEDEIQNAVAAEEFDRDGMDVEESSKYSAVYTSEWDKYKTHYFYNQLSEAGREFYDALDAVCAKLLLEKGKANQRQGVDDMGRPVTYYYTNYVSSKELSISQIMDIMLIFRYSNPQYYFTSAIYHYNTVGSTQYGALGIYSAFVDGAKRQKATNEVKKAVDQWVAQAGAYESNAQKVQYFHDSIIDKVEYNEAIYDEEYDDDKQYTQSAYSVFCKNKTVCAGYSMAFEMLCNAVDIDTVAVTSYDHAWNKVYLDNIWYNVDLTWDDQPVKYYEFFERSDEYYDTANAESREHHAEEAFWNGILPECPIDTIQTGDYTVPGTLPDASGNVESPTAKITLSGSKYKITLDTATPGADIYYTTDGSEPYPAYAKCLKYTSGITTGTLPQLRAMASYSGQHDSGVVDFAIVAYQANGAYLGSTKPQICTAGDSITIRQSSYERPGCTFLGWNTEKDGSGVSYAPDQAITNVTDNLTLYAQWEGTDIQMEIAYQLNGGKNDKSNPSSFIKGQTLTLRDASRTGYTFKGWYTDKGLKKKFKGDTKDTEGTLTLYAKWEKTKYKITYKLNGGKNHKSNPKTYDITSKTITLKNPTKKGYTFAGWYSDKKYTKKVKKIKKGSTGKITLYAKWKKK